MVCPNLHHRHIPTFYLNCIKYYQHFIKMNANTPSNNQDVKNDILWHNHRIQFNGKSLNFHRWATSGILISNDICNNGQISFDKIRNILRNVSNLYYELSKPIKAIPKEWKNLLDNRQGAEDLSLNETLVVSKSRNLAFKDIPTNLAQSKSVNSKSMLYWKEKFRDVNTDWGALWTRIFLDRSMPRTICDFNWRVFYGVLPIENRLKSMRKSDGICELCNCQTETLKHLFLECCKLGNIWNMVQGLLCKALNIDISVDYKTIILGKDIKEKKLWCN